MDEGLYHVCGESVCVSDFYEIDRLPSNVLRWQTFVWMQTAFPVCVVLPWSGNAR